MSPQFKPVDCKILVDKKVKEISSGPGNYQYTATPLWINIKRQGLKSSDRVFVQIISYETYCYRGQCTNKQSISERDLDFAEFGRFTGQMKPLNLFYQYNDGYALTRTTPYKHELVIWINGRLYKGGNGMNLPLILPNSRR